MNLIKILNTIGISIS